MTLPWAIGEVDIFGNMLPLSFKSPRPRSLMKNNSSEDTLHTTRLGTSSCGNGTLKSDAPIAFRSEHLTNCFKSAASLGNICKASATVFKKLSASSMVPVDLAISAKRANTMSRSFMSSSPMICWHNTSNRTDSFERRFASRRSSSECGMRLFMRAISASYCLR